MPLMRGPCAVADPREAQTLERGRIARDNGAAALRVDTTSAYSAAAADRLGYQRVFNVDYASLADAPLPDPPHTAASVYIKRT
ncbi:hypothetical protein EVAR_23253_1 [Eumeta japonica]|uniref:Uncharacterized protein n=1 Tax=Eumeta variegata TaxID=151549 RepID=A0A4C1V6M6_EUMVA|nr:hypothetical protein EVAR_23253_1 [Eumeta japonica]